MTHIVLTYIGTPDARKAAQIDLRRQLGARSGMTEQTGTVVEVDVDDAQMQWIEADPRWCVSGVYADVDPPRTNLAKAKAYLQKLPAKR